MIKSIPKIERDGGLTCESEQVDKQWSEMVAHDHIISKLLISMPYKVDQSLKKDGSRHIVVH